MAMSTLQSDDYAGLFGNFELECLAAWISNQAHASDKPFGEVVVSYRSFREDDNLMGGLCLALLYDLLKRKPGYNHYYVPTQKMVDIMRKRWPSIVDVPSIEFWINDAMGLR